ncbi:hypothetical protein L195_g025511 [Trifolium pratense]|uniref:Uncharacterized protein n=1 Tax=Trifolium pratense TaxID=57577 RepID=A0A2K3NGP7_TRIPR|nr:hypothetical protein L195_g025511 [Trifolium pratense]
MQHSPFKPPRRLFCKGQNHDGLTPKRTISRRCGLEVGSEQFGYYETIGITGYLTMRRMVHYNLVGTMQDFSVRTIGTYMAQNTQQRTDENHEHMPQQYTWQPPRVSLKCNVDAHSIIETEALALEEAMQVLLYTNRDHQFKMYPNGSTNFSPIVRGREIMAARAAARDAEIAAYDEAATSTGAVIGYKNYNVKNYTDLRVDSEDMVETTKGPLQQPRVQKIFIMNDNDKDKKRLKDQAREMGKRFGYYVTFSDQELPL